jgi:hypothetical protein
LVECPHENCAQEITLRNKLIPYKAIRSMVDDYLNDLKKEQEKSNTIKTNENEENKNDFIDDLLNDEYKFQNKNPNTNIYSFFNENLDYDIPKTDITQLNTNSNKTDVTNYSIINSNNHDQTSNESNSQKGAIIEPIIDNGMNRIPTTYNQNAASIRFMNHNNTNNRFNNRMHFQYQQQQQQQHGGYLPAQMNRHHIQQSQYLVGVPLTLSMQNQSVGYYPQQQQQQQHWHQQQFQRFPLHHPQQQQHQLSPVPIQQQIQNKSPTENIDINNNTEKSASQEPQSKR